MASRRGRRGRMTKLDFREFRGESIREEVMFNKVRDDPTTASGGGRGARRGGRGGGLQLVR